MKILILVIGLAILTVMLILQKTGTLEVSNAHLNWGGIIIHSLFVAGFLYLVVKLISKKPEIAQEWAITGMSCIIGWNMIIAITT